jgi:transposase
MRKSFDGLSGLVRNNLGLDPASGDVYVFLNRRRDRLKLLLWQGDGFALYYKRLEQGTFEYPRTSEDESSTLLNWHELMLILQGVELKSVTYRKRYKRA